MKKVIETIIYYGAFAAFFFYSGVFITTKISLLGYLWLGVTLIFFGIHVFKEDNMVVDKKKVSYGELVALFEGMAQIQFKDPSLVSSKFKYMRKKNSDLIKSIVNQNEEFLAAIKDKVNIQKEAQAIYNDSMVEKEGKKELDEVAYAAKAKTFQEENEERFQKIKKADEVMIDMPEFHAVDIADVPDAVDEFMIGVLTDYKIIIG
jgi:hypothetical protein